MTLRHLLDSEYAVIRALKPSALYQYRLSLTRFGAHLGHEATLEDLDPVRVQAWLAERKAKVSAATARKDRTHLVALWTHAAKRRFVEQFPTLPPLRAPQRIPRAYRVQDVSAILRMALAGSGSECGLPADWYWASLIRLCWETAERVGAVMQIRWDDLDLDERWVIFRGEHRKGGTRDIRRDISPELAGWLRHLQRKPADLVFPWTRERTSLWYEFRKLCAMAGVVNRGFHGLRKSAASYVAAAGGDATQLLDHSNPKLAKDHYLDESIVKPRQSAIDLLPTLQLDDVAAEKEGDAA
jgi:integrase